MLWIINVYYLVLFFCIMPMKLLIKQDTYICSPGLMTLKEQQKPASVLVIENKSEHFSIFPCHSQAMIIWLHFCITFFKEIEIRAYTIIKILLAK